MAGKAKRVLVVDDNADMRLMLGALLRYEGYDVEPARNGREALEVQRQRPVDVVITDLFMPEADGLETVERLRAEFPKLRLIVVSGGSKAALKTDDYLSVARELGCATLRKPFEPDALLKLLRDQ